MFYTLSNRFDGILKRLEGKGRLSEADVHEVLREIRTALLEADVHYVSSCPGHGPHRRRPSAPELSKALRPSSRSSRSSTTS